MPFKITFFIACHGTILLALLSRNFALRMVRMVSKCKRTEKVEFYPLVVG